MSKQYAKTNKIKVLVQGIPVFTSTIHPTAEIILWKDSTFERENIDLYNSYPPPANTKLPVWHSASTIRIGVDISLLTPVLLTK